MSFPRELDVVSSVRHLKQGCLIAQAEKRLMFAVLLDAVECLKKFAPLGQSSTDRLSKDAEEWIFEDDRDWPFSFINICEAVDLNPQYLRDGLKRWKPKVIRQSRASLPHGVLNGNRPRRTSLPRPA